MRIAIVPFLMIASLMASRGNADGQEPEAKSKIISVGVFKNGLAVVKREVQVSETGTYRLDVLPDSVHGSFWISGNCQVEAALKMREVDVPLFSGTMNGLQDDLAGKDVVVHLKDGKPALVGPVLRIDIARPVDEVGGTPRPAHGFLILKTANGYSYINPTEIAHIEVKHKEKTVKRLQPVLMLSVTKTDKKPVIFVSYIARGLGWTPSYLVDISDPKTLTIEMAAVIRNHMGDLNDTEIKLNFGYPGIPFADVTSPLSPRTNREKFPTYMPSDPRRGPYFFPTDGDVTSDENADMTFESLGKRNLGAGEVLSLTVAKAKTAYDRIVEWTVSSSDSESIAEELWDVFQFKNPFTLPMTAGPAALMDSDQFSGQRLCMPAKIGEDASLRIRKSVGIRTRGQETELPIQKDAKPELIRIGLGEYRRATIDGEMSVTNNRKQAIKIIVRRSLLAKVLSTEGNPKIQPRDEGVRTRNPSHDIVWTLTLAPGEERVMRYRYSAFLLNQLTPRTYGW